MPLRPRRPPTSAPTRGGQTRFRTTVIDASGVRSEQFRDGRAQITTVNEFNNGGTAVFHTHGHVTSEDAIAILLNAAAGALGGGAAIPDLRVARRWERR